MKKQCSECGEAIVGRADKRFCSDACRNAFNNKLNSDSTSYMRNVNNILRKNKRILEARFKGEKNKVLRDTLLKDGFDFNYFTTIYTTQKGSSYYYCYEMGYLPIENNYILIVKKEF
ncbi:hypothetical protein FLAV_00584 [Flavobacteriales bacterium]|jgi:hypothetical protein|nr:hypothetical protein [Flavobacteriales bacterium]MCL4815447.1 hypothetical protein [Flavobacteriales bacterium]WKZ75066.1 MAG: hypothetical protein QY303_13055 [Vicingaceae bacterium]GIK70008.1 MAG: hypothetical protein BroJett020_13030 [Bacteroidota bacterium]CAG0958787.1 hypothetical protein FLAV_00584 [Flavobacteriales bacterium]